MFEGSAFSRIHPDDLLGVGLLLAFFLRLHLAFFLLFGFGPAGLGPLLGRSLCEEAA